MEEKFRIESRSDHAESDARNTCLNLRRVRLEYEAAY
jgi:hypothetical protein